MNSGEYSNGINEFQLALEDYELGTENELNLLMVIWKKFCKVGIRGLDILVMPILII